MRACRNVLTERSVNTCTAEGICDRPTTPEIESHHTRKETQHHHHHHHHHQRNATQRNATQRNATGTTGNKPTYHQSLGDGKRWMRRRQLKRPQRSQCRDGTKAFVRQPALAFQNKRLQVREGLGKCQHMVVLEVVDVEHESLQLGANELAGDPVVRQPFSDFDLVKAHNQGRRTLPQEVRKNRHTELRAVLNANHSRRGDPCGWVHQRSSRHSTTQRRRLVE